MTNQLINTDIQNAIFGGLLIGSAAILMMLFSGRITGISDLFFQLSKPGSRPFWQLAFMAGLLGSVFFYYQFTGQSYPRVIAGWEFALVGGLLVGIGTKLGSGCTSGHGVCGISRFSLRSITATLVFMTTGVLSASLFSML